ncbi:peptidase U32 family protein [Niallia sp. XMNu-256]|uniref:peptidase U32 family protein n=1 Tax=Niallia sp. XMNu-256 TaxID=3082444 RepID=UPI0030CD85B9
MNKPELLVTPVSIHDILPLIEAGADAFLVGEQKFGLRLAGEFPRDDIKKAVEIAHEHGKKVYVAMNALFHNDKLPELPGYLQFLTSIHVDGVTFGDPAVLLAAREAAPDMKLHWSTETTGTNWYTCNYWGRKGAKRAVLAKEINLDAILEIKENAEIEIEVQVHGMLNMFQSKRSLLGNYFRYQGKDMEIEKESNRNGLFLHDKERGTKYPLFEDENGTHIMSPNDMCVIDELQELIEVGIDSFKIDGVLHSFEYILEVTKLYRKAIDICCEDPDAYEDIKGELLERIQEIQPASRPLDTGFFFKETVY